MDKPALAVEVEGLCKAYGPAPVLQQVHFALPQGRFAALTGPSGIGKTTLLRALAGLERIDAGLIRITGRTATTPDFCIPPEQRGLSMTFQEAALWPHMSVAGHLEFVLRAQPLARHEREARARHALEITDLAGRGRARPHELSGGEQQRLGIARALSVEAPLLLMDEPFAHLDEARAHRILEELKQRVRSKHTTVLLATHDGELLSGHADAVLRMEDLGR